MKECSSLIKWSLAIFLSLFILCVFIPNFTWIKSPFTAPIEVKIVDADNKPVSDMFAVIRWVINYSYFPDQGTGKNSHIILVKTDNNGRISIGRKIKPLSFAIFPLMNREFGGVHIITIDNRYEWASQGIGEDGRAEIKVSKIINKDGLVKNMEAYDRWEKYIYPDEASKKIAEYRDDARRQIDEYYLKLRNYK